MSIICFWFRQIHFYIKYHNVSMSIALFPASAFHPICLLPNFIRVRTSKTAAAEKEIKAHLESYS